MKLNNFKIMDVIGNLLPQNVILNINDYLNYSDILHCGSAPEYVWKIHYDNLYAQDIKFSYIAELYWEYGLKCYSKLFLILYKLMIDIWCIDFIPNILLKDKNFILLAIQERGGRCLEYADKSLKSDKKFILDAIKIDPISFEHADGGLKYEDDHVRNAYYDRLYNHHRWIDNVDFSDDDF